MTARIARGGGARTAPRARSKSQGSARRVNTQPGMTPLSLVPEQARARGIDYATLVERIVESAL